MNTRPLFPPLLAALAAVLLAVSVPRPDAFAQSPADAKVRLLSDAVRARAAGDLAAARALLDQVEALSPNDPAVRRLRAEIDAQNGTPASAAATTPAASTPAPRAEPAGPTPEQQAEALANAEAARVTGLINNAQNQLTAARTQLRGGRSDDALVVLDAAIGQLPVNPRTQSLLADLNKEKANALLDRAQAAVGRGDIEGARAALAASDKISPMNGRAIGIESQIARIETRAAGGRSGSAAFIAERASIAQLAAKGRAQYLVGDIDGAQGTFRALEAQDPDNTVAKGFLLRIAEEKTETGALNREKTRAQLLEEVAKGWQRPGIYQERARDADQAAAVAPLAKKLNEITLPSVSFTRTEIGQVVAALSAISEEFDASGAAVKGVNIVLLDPSNKNPTVTITLRNATLKRVLDFVTEGIGYQYEVQADAVVVRPGGETSNLETQFFPVTRATVLRMTGITGGTGSGGGATAAGGASKDPYSAGGAGAAETSGSGGEAGSMRGFLQQAGVSFTVEGSSLAYDGSAIIVTQTARNIERIRNILGRYNDVRQVEIEAKFLEVQEGALEELGVTWNATRRGVPQINPATGAPILDANGRQTFVPQETYTTAGNTRSLVGGFPSTTNSAAINISDTTGARITTPVAPATIPGGVSLASTAGALGTITGFVGEFDVSAVVRALSQKQGTDLLSSPKITVLSGNPANITVAQELRYPQSYGEIQSQVGSGTGTGTGLSAAGVTITAGTPQEFATRNVGVELKVTPTVEEDDYSISLDLNPRVTEFEGFVEYGGPSIAISSGVTVTVPPGFYQPIFSVRDISTKVTIWDGATLVMGGLTREEVKKVNDKVPFFGDLPIIGRLFRSKGESSQKRNLLIFVTANLVSPGGSPKKQNLKNTPASSLFQNPTIVTPTSAEPRTRTGSGSK
ncbi:MAG: type II secretory pathway, component PulD [Opitutus sp.]|nr:type II secretory pathway, component PulD [Opitutus sp.]